MTQNNIENPPLESFTRSVPVAIIGMASVFPGASNLQQFWDIILNKLDCITDVPASRWNIEDYYDPDPKTPDKTYCKRGGFIPDLDFDPAEFGLPPNILEATDVSQLLALQIAKEVLKDAGYATSPAAVRERTGIILGTVVGQQLMRPLLHRLQYPVWQKVLKSSGLSDEASAEVIEKIKAAYSRWEENSFPGFLSNVIAGRIANRLDLGGINCVVDAACASSLSAVNMAVNELSAGHTDMMITGGVDIDNSILTYMCFSKTPAFSKKENVRPFDTASDGMMVGEGIGMLVLKRLADAERDGDRIYAVIKGIGASSDGRSKSIYAPHPAGQVKALERAYQAAGFSPQTIGLVEAHGTGTVAGDICEVTALSQVFSQAEPGAGPIALGSVKSQIGHTKAAAGAASLIKTALALYHKVLPPTINITEPNPKLKLDQTPFYLNTEARPWLGSPGEVPRRAGVSSFGFGGTNFHVVLEEYTTAQPQAYRLNKAAQSLLLQAPTPGQLLALLEEYRLKFNSPEADFYYNELVESSKKLVIPPTAARLGFLARDRSEAVEKLELSANFLTAKPQAADWDHPKGIFYRQQALQPSGKVVALFSGQGAQYLEMGRKLAVNFPPVREAFKALDELFQAENQPPLSGVVFPPPSFENSQQAARTAALQRTDYAQPAIGALSSSLYRLLVGAGFQADFTAGHSFGELSALLAAGVLSEAAYFRLVKARGKAMAAPSDDPTFDPGTMLAVSGNLNGLAELLPGFPEITVANLNSPDQVVLAGTKPAVARFKAVLKERQFSVVDLPVAAAFHTPLVGHAQQPFEAAIQAEDFQSPRIPVFSNSTAQPYPAEPGTIREMLGQHLLKPVLFKQQIENIYAAGGFFFVEFGPRDILTNLVKNILGDKPHLAVALNPSRQKDSDSQLRQAVIQLRVAGIALQDVDPYQKQPTAPGQVKKSVLNVRLNGSPYVSEASRQLFQKALTNGTATALPVVNKPAPAAVVASAKEVIKGTSKEATAINIEEATMPSNSLSQPASAPNQENPTSPEAESAFAPAPPATAPEIAILEANLDRFTGYQSAAVQVHEQYLNNQAEYTRGFFQLMQQQQSLLLNAEITPAPGVVESIERNMMRFHDYQSATLRVHDHFLSQEADYSRQLFETIGRAPLDEHRSYAPQTRGWQPASSARLAQPVAPAPVYQAPAPAAQVTLNPRPAPTPTVEAPVNHSPYQTPAPAIAATREAVRPEIPAAARPESLPVEVVPPVAPLTAPGAGVVQETALNGQAISTAELTRHLVQVVSDKTGYPVEMLALDMDMEADLGIDSIKRVEILGAMQDSFPALPRLNSDALAEMRTLAQIVESMAVTAPDTTPVPAPTNTQPEDGSVSKNGTSTGLTGGIVRLKPLPGPDYLEAAPPPDHVCLVTDDGSRTPARLAEDLSKEGWRPVILGWPSRLERPGETLPQGVVRVSLEDPSESGLTQALNTITGKYGPIGGFIHLSPPAHPDRADGLPFDEAENQVVKQVFLLAKHLKKSLHQAASLGRACFLTVARLDGNLGLGQPADFGVTGGGLFGLTKSLGQEWPDVYCRALDLSPELDAEQAAYSIMRELHDPNRLLAEVGYSLAGRVTLVSEEAGVN